METTHDPVAPPVTPRPASESKLVEAVLLHGGTQVSRSYRKETDMCSATATVVVPAPQDDVFDYLSRIESVPEWATEFVEAFEVRGPGEARARTRMGEVIFRIEADRDTGVIDMLVGPGPEETTLFPARVVPLGAEHSAFTFTMFRDPNRTEDAFRAEFESLERELDNVVRRFSETTGS